MQFSPASSTVIEACPVGSSHSSSTAVTPASASARRANFACSSRPTAPMKITRSAGRRLHTLVGALAADANVPVMRQHRLAGGWRVLDVERAVQIHRTDNYHRSAHARLRSTLSMVTLPLLARPRRQMLSAKPAKSTRAASDANLTQPGRAPSPSEGPGRALRMLVLRSSGTLRKIHRAYPEILV